ncbi:MAG: FAD-dependent oxidoreductase [Asticcacaulis sp.]
MDRRHILQMGAAAAGLATLPRLARAQEPAQTSSLPLIRADPSQIFRITVCLRPFRAQGPRIENETIGRKQVVHNYGHGGSGWSLSWGSAEAAVKLAMQNSPKKIAVIGAGALGLTAAITAQRAGAEVTIYAKERFPFVRSANATGSWTPSSRVAKTESVSPDFAERWEAMARKSYSMHQSYISLPGNPVEWMDQYHLHNRRPEYAALPPQPEPGFISLDNRLDDIEPDWLQVPNEAHPFASDNVTRSQIMTFNVASLAHQMTMDFLAAGGRFVPAEFHSPFDFTKLKERVIINCTGYGARALLGDNSVIPVRGQIAWLPSQDGVHYSLMHQSVLAVARRDGIVVQELGPNENFGWNDANETTDPAAAEYAVRILATAYRT